MRALLITLVLVSSLVCAKEIVTTLPKADLIEMEKKLPGTTLPDSWQNAHGLVIFCGEGRCTVSCEPEPPLDAPERTLKANDYGCTFSLTPKHVSTYLGLIERARKKKKRQWDKLHIAECGEDVCRIHTKREPVATKATSPAAK
jgi:hypothetical protein